MAPSAPADTNRLDCRDKNLSFLKLAA
ncbi:hypothetical protein CCACVL1_29804 [Corchorus capsularis]|uniref:Uncharacterized protein n=1 Tax=Corchorus capsularis TaxID=210143 RepID=A0A1R3G086_COCAP|nr:hypothetical protein CCACVL1_29804 [Corchorus capsularis]